MDSMEEEIVKRMYCKASMYVIILVITIMRRLQARRKCIPLHSRDEIANNTRNRNALMNRITDGYIDSCRGYIRMRKFAFNKLVRIMRRSNLLKDSGHVTVEEQLVMFLNILGHKTKNRVVRSNFIRSGETVSRYFNKVLGAICHLRGRYMKQATNEVSQEIANNPLYYPYFKDCIGMIDGTHVDAMLPTSLVARFRGRKGVTQNVLAACTPNKLFCYVLAGWEGSANDYRILQDALSRPSPHGLRVYDGKYYLCDAGYTTMPGFISPYRGVRYHLKEHTGKTPNNRKELFNLRHSSLRSKIESAFGILKNRFKILSAKPHYPFPSQVDIVLACTVLHNFIATVDPGDELLNENMPIDEEEEDDEMIEEVDEDIVDYTQNMTQREQTQSRNEWKERRDQIAWDMWVDYCEKYRHGNTIETGN